MSKIVFKNSALINARKAAGLSQRELAKAAQCSRASILNWENGHRSPTLAQLSALAIALGTTPDKLMPTPETDKQLEEERERLIYEQNVKAIPQRIGRTVKVPVLSREFTACCGSGVGAFDITNDSEEFLEVPMSDLRIFDTMRPPFAVYADGNCLSSLGIEPNDQIIINPAEEPVQGALCLVTMHEMNSIKWLFRLPKGVICLRSDNGDLELSPQQQEDMNFAVIGVVIGIKKPRPTARVY